MTSLGRFLEVVSGFLLVFIVVNFEFGVGTTFALLLFLSVYIRITDKKVSFKVVKNKVDWGKTALYVLGAYASLIIISSLVLPVIAWLFKLTFKEVGLLATVNFIIQTKAALFSQITPALVGSLFLIFLTWAILIALVETITILGRGFEFTADVAKIKRLKLSNKRLWLVMIIVSTVFMLFHLTALGVTDALSLTTVFLFGFISVILVVLTGQLLEAILFHVLANTVAILSSGQFAGFTISSTGWIMIGIIGLFVILSIRKKKGGIPLLSRLWRR